MFRQTCVIAILVVAQSGCHNSATDRHARSADRLHEEAVKLAMRGDFDGSMTLLDEAIRIAPDHADLYVSRGTVSRKRGEFAAGIQDLSRAIELNPTFAEAYCQRAFAYQQSELDPQGKQAFADANHAIELDRTIPLSYIIRGNALLTRGQIDPAIDDFGETIKLNPRSSVAYGNRARAYAERGDIAMAQRDLDTAFSLNPAEQDRARLEEIKDDLRQRSENRGCGRVETGTQQFLGGKAELEDEGERG